MVGLAFEVALELSWALITWGLMGGITWLTMAGVVLGGSAIGLRLWGYYANYER